MNLKNLERVADTEWHIPPTGAMRVPGVIYGDAALIGEMDDKVRQQICNVAALPGIVKGSFAMPDAHWGYGFPIGGVAAFDPGAGGVVSAGGVGFDISCGVRCMTSGLDAADIDPAKDSLAGALFAEIPAGLGSTGRLHLDDRQMDAMLTGGARWALECGYGEERDLSRIEESGSMPGADPDQISARARERQRDEMGTLGSGNHYLEVQVVDRTYDDETAAAFGLREGGVVVSIHCGSRGLGHQVGTEFLAEMVAQAPKHGIRLPDRELACAPLESDLGRRYLGAMRAGINCALANRQIIGHLARKVFGAFFPDVALPLLFDVSHNTCKEESHGVGSGRKRLFVHRKGATRAFGPNAPGLPDELRSFGQPVIIGGTMGTASYVLAGTRDSEAHAFASACHGAGRQMSRHQARKRWSGRAVVDELASQGILVRGSSLRGITEEAPGAYKDVHAVVEVAERARLAKKIARLKPVICVKG